MNMKEELLLTAKENAVQLLLDVAMGKPQLSGAQTGSDEQMNIYPTLEQRLRASLALVRITPSSLNLQSSTNEDTINELDTESLRRLLVERLSR